MCTGGDDETGHKRSLLMGLIPLGRHSKKPKSRYRSQSLSPKRAKSKKPCKWCVSSIYAGPKFARGEFKHAHSFFPLPLSCRRCMSAIPPNFENAISFVDDYGVNLASLNSPCCLLFRNPIPWSIIRPKLKLSLCASVAPDVSKPTDYRPRCRNPKTQYRLTN